MNCMFPLVVEPDQVLCRGGDQAAVLLPPAGHQRQQGSQPSPQEPLLYTPQDRLVDEYINPFYTG